MTRRLVGFVLVAAVLAPACQSGPITVEITSPSAPALHVVGTPLTLRGRAVTPQGQTVSAATLTWSSSLHGRLGTGASVAPVLAPGLHKITLSATYQTYSASATTTVLVRPPDQNLFAYAGALVSGALSSLIPNSGEVGEAIRRIPGQLLGVPVSLPPSFHAMLGVNPTNINAAVGNGRLTAGVSKRGVLTTLRWPSPGHPDHLDYLTRDRALPEMGAKPNMGAYAGLRVTTSAGTRVTWLRDSEWTAAQTYLSDSDNVARTTFLNATLGLTVVQLDFVVPAPHDVLVRKFAITRAPGSPVTAARLVHYANLAPCTYRIPRVPVTDWLLDLFNDFALVYHSGADAAIHFRPQAPQYRPLLDFAVAPHADLQSDVNAFADGLDARFGAGVYFAMGGDAPADAVRCLADYGPDLRLSDAPSPYAFGRGSSLWEKSLSFTGGSATSSFYVAAGSSSAQARDRLSWARAMSSSSHLGTTSAWWSTWLSSAVLPATTDAQVLRVCKRGLISIRTATADSGAIVASIAAQPPYGLDWPRDGAFLNLVLDMAGYRDLVTRHNLFYASVGRTMPVFGGTYEMNYWADGMAAGHVLLEIDNAAMVAWTLWKHASFLSGSARAAYLAAVYPALKRTVNFVAAWRDPSNGLVAPANEDDNIPFTQGLHGAASVYLALQSGIDAGTAVGESSSTIGAWTARRNELRSAILSRYYDSSTGTYGFTGGMRGPVWFLWPGEVVAPTSPAATAQAGAIWTRTSPFFEDAPGTYMYNAEHMLALAHVWGAQGVYRTRLEDALEKLTHDLPTPGTNHYGEAYVVGPGPTYTHLNDVPHVWEHALVYLLARKLYGP